MENNATIKKLDTAILDDNKKTFLTEDFLHIVKSLANNRLSPSETLQAVSEKKEFCLELIAIGQKLDILSEEDDNLSRVLSSFGKEGLLKLTLISSFVKFLKYDTSKYWHNICLHSIITAFVAETFAEFSDKSQKHKLFSCGLMHDIGKLILFKYDKNTFTEIQNINDKDKNKRLIGNEKIVMGITHQEIGKYFLQKWFFPKCIYDSAGNHHFVDRDTPSRDEAAIVLAANNLAKGMELGQSDDYFVNPIPKWIWNSLQIREYQFKEVIEEIYEKIDNFKISFEDLF